MLQILVWKMWVRIWQRHVWIVSVFSLVFFVLFFTIIQKMTKSGCLRDFKGGGQYISHKSLCTPVVPNLIYGFLCKPVGLLCSSGNIKHVPHDFFKINVLKETTKRKQGSAHASDARVCLSSVCNFANTWICPSVYPHLRLLLVLLSVSWFTVRYHIVESRKAVIAQEHLLTFDPNGVLFKCSTPPYWLPLRGHPPPPSLWQQQEIWSRREWKWFSKMF